jgi:multidrug efflux pump subunit AcrA (membrane-fusion protein)
MKKNFRQWLATSIDAIYFIVVFVVALSLSTLALTRRLNSYEASQSPLLLHIEKDEIVITNSVSGRVDKVLVSPGQHIKKGDLLVQLNDEITDAKLSTLDEIAKDNTSARTEAMLLRAQSPQFELRAPRDGVVYKVSVVEGSYLSGNTPVVTMFSDSNVKLLGTVSPEQYVDLQKEKKLDAFSSRREQIYSVKLEGVSRVLPPTQDSASKYELYFNFINPDDATAFIQGENLDVVAKSRDGDSLKPGYLIAKFWNSFIIGK